VLQNLNEEFQTNLNKIVETHCYVQTIIHVHTYYERSIYLIIIIRKK